MSMQEFLIELVAAPFGGMEKNKMDLPKEYTYEIDADQEKELLEIMNQDNEKRLKEINK